MDIKDLVYTLFEEAGTPVLRFFHGRPSGTIIVLVEINNCIRKIGLKGTRLFICSGSICDHNEKHSVDLSDPDSLEVIKSWIPWLESLGPLKARPL